MDEQCYTAFGDDLLLEGVYWQELKRGLLWLGSSMAPQASGSGETAQTQLEEPGFSAC